MKRLFILLIIVFLIAPLGLAQFSNTPTNSQPSVSITWTPASGNSGARATGSITTLFGSNGGLRGNMVDITPRVDLWITSIDINATLAGSPTNVDIWYYVGTCVGHDKNPKGWTLLDSGTGVAAGLDMPTSIPLPNASGFTFKKGQVYGLYFDMTNYPNSYMNYTKNIQPTYSNPDIVLKPYYAKGDPAFFGNTFTPRVWNGTIYYESQDPLTTDVFVVSEASGGKVTFSLDASVSNANRNYFIFSGVTGTSPGFIPPPGLVTIPINWDVFTNLAISLANTSIFQNFYGTLDVNGKATAVFDTLGPFTGGAGLTLNFAFGLDLSYWNYASNAVSIDIIP